MLNPVTRVSIKETLHKGKGRTMDQISQISDRLRIAKVWWGKAATNSANAVRHLYR